MADQKYETEIDTRGADSLQTASAALESMSDNLLQAGTSSAQLKSQRRTPGG